MVVVVVVALSNPRSMILTRDEILWNDSSSTTAAAAAAAAYATSSCAAQGLDTTPGPGDSRGGLDPLNDPPPPFQKVATNCCVICPVLFLSRHDSSYTKCLLAAVVEEPAEADIRKQHNAIGK